MSATLASNVTLLGSSRVMALRSKRVINPTAQRGTPEHSLSDVFLHLCNIHHWCHSRHALHLLLLFIFQRLDESHALLVRCKWHKVRCSAPYSVLQLLIRRNIRMYEFSGPDASFYERLQILTEISQHRYQICRWLI